MADWLARTLLSDKTQVALLCNRHLPVADSYDRRFAAAENHTRRQLTIERKLVRVRGLTKGSFV
jgi:hypothetical protein